MFPYVSIHGAHSKEFCSHAKDSLENIIQEYVRKGFSWIGITEHIPPPENQFLYPEEITEKLTPKKMYIRFQKYFKTARKLQQKYENNLKIFVGFETESFNGYINWIQELKREFTPDYIVGSLHHIKDIPIDFDNNNYQRLVKKLGNIENVYKAYFDLQYEMIKTLKPEVIGHMDLVRIFDPNYKSTLQKPEVWKKIERNLKLIKKYNLILDYNLRAFKKGALEPYISNPILQKAFKIGVRVYPGDDSHETATVGIGYKKAMNNLKKIGFNIAFPPPFTF